MLTVGHLKKIFNKYPDNWELALTIQEEDYKEYLFLAARIEHEDHLEIMVGHPDHDDRLPFPF